MSQQPPPCPVLTVWRFAILRHDDPDLHWDLLLEAGDHCKTWRLTAVPQDDTDIPATPIADHRRFYLDYEGPVSGDRGTVERWDRGAFVWWTATPQLIRGYCDGAKFRGEVQLIANSRDSDAIARFFRRTI